MLTIAKYAKYAKSIKVKALESGVAPVKLTTICKGDMCDDENVDVALTRNGKWAIVYVPGNDKIKFSTALENMDGSKTNPYSKRYS